MMDKVNVVKKFDLFNEQWSPKVIGELNDSYVKIAKLQGEFLWHLHEGEDEMFYVIKGQLVIKLREKDVVIEEGEFFIVPRGIEHMPVAKEEAHVMMIESKTTLNTGNVTNEKTVEKLEWI